MILHRKMVLSWRILLTIIDRGMVLPNPQIRTSFASSKRPYSLSNEIGTPLWWMLYGLTKSHLILPWTHPLTSWCTKRKPSSLQTYTFLLSNCPKNPKASHVYWFNIGWTHYTSYKKKGWKQKKSSHFTKTISRDGLTRSLQGTLASMWVT